MINTALIQAVITLASIGAAVPLVAVLFLKIEQISPVRRLGMALVAGGLLLLGGGILFQPEAAGSPGLFPIASVTLLALGLLIYTWACYWRALLRRFEGGFANLRASVSYDSPERAGDRIVPPRL